jgi:hypothetical protein
VLILSIAWGRQPSSRRSGKFEANLGGHVYKKRIRFEGKGKSGSEKTIVCYQKDDNAIYVHGFAKTLQQSRNGSKVIKSRLELPRAYQVNSGDGNKAAARFGKFMARPDFCRSLPKK